MIDLPFSREEFLGVFGRYNEAVWPAQPALLLLGVGAVVLAARARPAADRAAAGILGALCLAQGALLLWQGAWRGALAFRVRADASGAIGALLALYALAAYPAL
ncbi:MAG TPA: DUF6064 family protein, partial [Longimicrobiaceae bacterium]